MKKKKALYPGIAEAERERKRAAKRAAVEKPLMIGTTPNYDAFPGWTAEQVLVFLNID